MGTFIRNVVILAFDFSATPLRTCMKEALSITAKLAFWVTVIVAALGAMLTKASSPNESPVPSFFISMNHFVSLCCRAKSLIYQLSSGFLILVCTNVLNCSRFMSRTY